MDNPIQSFFTNAEHQDSPLRALTDFLNEEARNEQAGNYEKMRFVGYVLDLGFDDATIITSDPFKKAVGGVPRGSFLIMAPDSLEGMPPHFSLLRVKATAPTPLSREVQQTYFELHKKSMPDLDIWTKGELQWGALSANVLGMFFPDQANVDKIAFSGDVNNVVSAHRYKVYAPTDQLLEIIVNGIVRPDNQFPIGKLRLTECSLPFANSAPLNTYVRVSTSDFRGFRTAMFGKTRLGKSNVVKIIAQSIIETTKNDNSVGQLIFDINGEYANDNPQDGNKSLRSAYPDRCQVYALTPREQTPSETLRINFYEQPASCIGVLRSLLEKDGRTSDYIRGFYSADLPSLEGIAALQQADRDRPIRKVLYYWAILSKAGYSANEQRLRNLGMRGRNAGGFDPHFNKPLREAAYGHAEKDVADPPNSLNSLEAELEVIAKFVADNPNSEVLNSSSGKPLFEPEDKALLKFFSPTSTTSSGPSLLQAYKYLHSPDAGDFLTDVVALLDQGKTVILDLGNATDEIRGYFADMLSWAVFRHQEKKFVGNDLGDHYVQLYFEEAHNVFPTDNNEFTGVYTRFAKEGAKFHIGMVYSTQSPSTINKELLAQTENFFVAHMSSQGETEALARLQVQFDGLQQDILKTRTPGYMRMMTFSHRFIIPVQVNKFEATAANDFSEASQQGD
ncbi:MAG: DUF87 domain-containing protein [Syntrophaceae bacterium]|nr:DUF87 domain-containing protein [Syntrophaceae bacterium]